MKYTGRICALIVLLVVDLTYIIYFYNKMGYIDMFLLITSILLVLVTWFLGEIFHKIQFYFKELNKSKEELQQIFDSVDAALWSFEISTSTLLVSTGFEKIYEVSRQKFLDNPRVWQEVVHPEDIKLVKECNEKLFSGESSSVVYRIIREKGEVRWVKDQGTPIFDSSGKLTKVNGAIFDITDSKKAEEKIRQLAYYDNLTELPNRNMLSNYFNELVNNSKIEKQEIGVMFLDLDRFKIINDTMGHAFGDIVLQQFSKRLLKCVGKDDMVSRYGGDEFIILLKNTNQSEATRVAQRIINEFSYPLIVNMHKIFSTPSIGVSLYPKSGEDLETLIKCADIAMFFAKEKGKNSYQFYTYNQSKDISKKMYLENELRRALENNEFILYYQPQLNLNTGKIVGVEALIRWRHPEFGMISPAEFIPVAEETGLIIPIGKWILKTACEQNKNWQDAGFPPIYVAVNISVYQFQHKDFVETINQVLAETKLNPQYLELEMTESIMQNMKQLMVVLNELKNIGIKLSLDDFGTGYSSLNVLRYLPIDNLKIDKSFIDDIMDDLNTAPIIKTIIDMGKNLKLSVIAEGIEKKEQVDFLKQNKCDIGQGYLFSVPLPAEEINKILFDNSIIRYNN